MQFADRMGVSTPTVCKWEQGRAYPEAWRLPVMAAVLSCSIDALFGKAHTQAREAAS